MEKCMDFYTDEGKRMATIITIKDEKATKPWGKWME